MENVKQKGFGLFLSTIFAKGEPANEPEVTEYDTLPEFYGLGNGMAELRKGENAVAALEKAFPTFSKNDKVPAKVDNIAPKAKVEKEVPKAPQVEQKEEKEIGD